MAERAHAKLSASGAHRWMPCPGSVRLEENFPDTTSEFAEYGTAGHDLGETCLIHDTDPSDYIGDEFNNIEVDEEMAVAVDKYVEYVRCLPGYKMYEKRVDYSPWVPDGFGTSDAICIHGDTVYVVDLKMGQGVQVYAEGNPQAMLYALGTYNMYQDFMVDCERIVMVIVQPRLDHISEHEISIEELLEFGETARECAKAVEQDDAALVPGKKQCQFCKAKGSCKALAEYSFNMAMEGFEDLSEVVNDELDERNPDLLTNEEIAALIPNLGLLEKFVSAVRSQARTIMLEGGEIPGYKLVAGRSDRKWQDEGKVERALKRLKFKNADVFTTKLISPAQAEKLLGKGHSLLERYVVKPKGNPTMAPQSDKREAIELNPDEGFEAQ